MTIRRMTIEDEQLRLTQSSAVQTISWWGVLSFRTKTQPVALSRLSVKCLKAEARRPEV